MKKNGVCIKKLNSNAGMSLAETLISMIILLLVSSGLVATIMIASDQYKEANRYSEAKILISSLSNVIVDDLTNAEDVKTHINNDVIVMDSYTSRRFYNKTMLTSDSNGRLIAQNVDDSDQYYNLLSEKAYLDDLKAKINYFYYSPKANSFKLEIEIYNGDTIYSNKQLTVLDIANIY